MNCATMAQPDACPLLVSVGQDGVPWVAWRTNPIDAVDQLSSLIVRAVELRVVHNATMIVHLFVAGFARWT